MPPTRQVTAAGPTPGATASGLCRQPHRRLLRQASCASRRLRRTARTSPPRPRFAAWAFVVPHYRYCQPPLLSPWLAHGPVSSCDVAADLTMSSPVAWVALTIECPDVEAQERCVYRMLATVASRRSAGLSNAGTSQCQGPTRGEVTHVAAMARPSASRHPWSCACQVARPREGMDLAPVD